MGHDALISFCSLERRIADACVEALEAGGWTCWISHRDIVPGKHYSEAIIDAINEARSLVLIFSKSADESPHVLREVERAVNRRMPVITFRVEDRAPCKSLEYFLSSPHWLDAWTEPLEPHLERLDRTLEALLGPRRTPEPVAVVDAPASTPVERESCPGCEAENPARAVFCPHCGIALVETCGFCGEEGRTALLFCAGCGANKPAYERAAKLVAQAKAGILAHRYEEALAATTAGLEFGELADDLRVLAEQARSHLTALEEFEPGLERHLEAAEFDAAATLIEVVERSKPGDDRFERAREHIAAARRAHEIRTILEAARADLEEGRRFDAARAGCTRVLEMEPRSPEALALRDRAEQVQADYVERLAAVERWQADGIWESALASLQALAEEFPWSEEVVRRRETVTRLQQREARYLALKAGLPALLEAEDWKRARKAVDEILALRPDDGEAKAQRKELKRKIVPQKAAGRARPSKHRAPAAEAVPATPGTTVEDSVARRFGPRARFAALAVVVGLAVVLLLQWTGDGGHAVAVGGNEAGGSASAVLQVEEGGLAVPTAPHDVGSQPAPREASPPAAEPVILPGDAGEPEKPAVTEALDMLGWSRAAAETWCHEHGWPVAVVNGFTPDPTAVGTIIGQIPGPGVPLSKGDFFKLSVGVLEVPAAPPAIVTEAPDLLGWTLSTAEAWCRERGQLVEVRHEFTDDPREVGTVFAQDPAPGEPLPRSALFTLRVGAPQEAPRHPPSATPPNALAIGDVVPDYEFTTFDGETFRLSILNTRPAAVNQWVLALAQVYGAKSPDLSTRLDAFLQADAEPYRSVHSFVSASGRKFGLLPSQEKARSMQSLDDVTRWVLSHARDPIVLVPWSFQCPFCGRIMEELGEVLAASGARCIALGGQYGDSREDVAAFLEKYSFHFLLVDDTSHRISEELGLHQTCRFAVLDADLRLYYRGVLSSRQSTGTGIDEEGAWLVDAIKAAKRRGSCFVPPPNVPPNTYG